MLRGWRLGGERVSSRWVAFLGEWRERGGGEGGFMGGPLEIW